MGKKQTTTVRNDPFSGEMKKKYDDFYPYLKGRIDKPPQYDGPYTAGLTDTEKQGIASLRDLANTSFLRDTMSGKYLDPASNPYLSKTADIISRRMGEQFGQATDAIDSRVNRQGFWGGSAHQGMMDQARNDLATRQGEALNSLYGNAYNSERDRQFQALGSAGNLGQALLGAGGVERGVADTDLQRRYEAWMGGQGLQQQDIGNLLNYFNLGKNPTQTQTQSGGGLGNFLGTALGAWASGGFGGLGGLGAKAGYSFGSNSLRNRLWG